MGYGLILTSIFKALGINVLNHKNQLVQNNNIVSHLHLPPKPLIIFKPTDHDSIESQLNLFAQIDSLNSMTQMVLQIQSNIVSKIEELQLSMHHLKDMISALLENQKVSLSPYQFTTDTSSTGFEPNVQKSSDATLPTLGLHFSPVNSDDF